AQFDAMNNVLLAAEVRVDDSNQSIGEDVTVGDIAGEVIIDGIRGDYDKQPRQYAASTLRTSDYLRGRPRQYVRRGRTPYVKEETREEEDEDPPQLSDPDGGYASHSMKKHFRLYADATLRKATNFFQDGASTSQSVPVEEEVVQEKNVIQITEEPEEPEEELENLYTKSPNVIEQEGGMEPKEMFYETVDEQRTDEFDLYFPKYTDQAIDFPEACDMLIGNTHFPEDKVCKTTPQQFKGVGTFIVDWSSLNQQSDIANDGLGSWGKPSGRTRFYQLDEATRKYVCVSDARGQIQKGTPFDVKCQLRKYEHPTTTMIDNGANRFIKKIVSCVWKDTQTQSHLAIITYDWIGTPFDFIVHVSEPRRTRNVIPKPPEGARNWEAASIQATGFDSFPSTCMAMMGDCPLYSMGAIQFHDVCNLIMGATLTDNNKICDRIPQRFQECGTFVIDVTALNSENELRRDDNGQWGKPAGNSRYFKIDGKTATRLDRCGRLEPNVRAEQSYDLQVLCKRYEHPMTDNRFVRKIYTGRTPIDKQYHQTAELAVITYFWKGEPTPFDPVLPQRKVRLHESSDFEIMKRTAENMRELPEYDDETEEDEMVDLTSEVVSMYMEQEAAHIEDSMMPGSSMEPPARKRKKSDGSSMVGERHPVQRESRQPTLDEIQCAKMALENQQRFAMLMDRMESVAEKMERMADMQLNMWTRQYHHEPRERPVEEYVEEEVVYEMDG
ncbi:hypothetical protein PENTCL1PPCAC_4417, partial [Pristionchus entomophagus]